MSSSMVKRFRRISPTMILPSRITMLGRLHSKARKRMLFTVNTDRMADQAQEG